MDYTNVLSDIHLDWSDPYRYLDGFTKTKYSILVSSIAYMIIGTLVIFCVIAFERYGGDPQKRSIQNQIIFHIGILVIIYSWILIPLQMWRISAGPLDYHAAQCMVFLKIMALLTHGLYVAEYIMFRYFTLVILKRVPPIIDDFVTQYLAAANFTISLVWTYVARHEKYMTSMILRYVGLHSTTHQVIIIDIG